MATVRRDVWQLPSNDKTLLWYGRAIAEMQKRPITDPTSWRFQAAIHDYDRATDPLAVRGEALPSPAVRRRFWQQCQHGSWFFLPWHRMYLHFFEQMIAAEVVRLGGPADWALPYWNYSRDIQSRLLPPAFRNPTLPDGSKNFLFVAERDPRCNAGQQFTDDFDVALQTALTEAFFSDSTRGNFGGLPTNFSHNGQSGGQLESTPHGSIHVAVGGSRGWMGGFNTAGLDPIFWLHHANIDRLWEVWLKRNRRHRNPTSLQWLSRISFSFYNAKSAAVVMRCSEVISTSALGYTYQDVSDPLPAPSGGLESPTAEREITMPNPIPPELVGATETSFQIKDAPARIQVPTPFHEAAQARIADAVSGLESVSDADAEPHILLQLENLTASGRANSYDVYVNIPEGEEPTRYPEQRTGRLDLFGVAEASRANDRHPGSGLTYTLDISGIYQTLSTQAGWNPDNIQVSFVPVRDWEGATVTVGRVSLFLG